MTHHRRSSLEGARRGLYKTQRTIGDF